MYQEIKIPEFETKKELFDFLIKNREVLITQKKSKTKHADGISIDLPDVAPVKKNNGVENQVEVKVVMNSTNILDSHSDVHIPGLWNKSLKENRRLMHLQEHKLAFEKIISDGNDLKAYTKNYTWNDLGFGWQGKTEALIFESVVKRDRNEYMMEQYQKGLVNNHSVGMQYVKMILCVGDEDYGAEYEAWEKYLPMIANREIAENKGYFWAVKEAKLIEGSAVPLGSNYATPTLEIKDEPLLSTLNNKLKSLLPNEADTNETKLFLQQLKF